MSQPELPPRRWQDWKEIERLEQLNRELAEALQALLYEVKQMREDFEYRDRRDPSAMSPPSKKNIQQSEEALRKAGY